MRDEIFVLGGMIYRCFQKYGFNVLIFSNAWS